jgi:hypothetical protein
MKWFILLLTFTVMLSFAASQSNAQILFHADFEDNEGANDPGKWNANNVSPGKHVYKIEDGWLTQTADDCSNSTKTLFPADSADWSDYTVAVDIRWRGDIGDANDVLSIIFRYTDPNSYYQFSIGASQYNLEWWLADTHANEGACFDSPLPPADRTLAQGVHGIAIDEGGKTAYTAVIKVEGDKIEAFFGEQVDVKAGQMPPKVGEATGDKYQEGTAGLHMASVPASFDNITVFGANGLPVDARYKLSSLWGALKSSDH